MGGIGGAISAIGSADAQAKGDYQNAHNALDLYWEEMNQAGQVSTSMTQHLTTTLANINAVRAQRGAELVSPSGTAVENATFGLASQDISRTVGNYQAEAYQNLDAWQFYNQAAASAHDAAGLGVIGSLLGGVGGLLKF